MFSFLQSLGRSEVLPIVRDLNVDKAHGWDQLSTRMIKTCGDAITFSLKLIFKSMINEGVFPMIGRKVM